MHLRNTEDFFISQNHTLHIRHSSRAALWARWGCRQHRVHPSSPGAMRHGTCEGPQMPSGPQTSSQTAFQIEVALEIQAPNSLMVRPFIDKNLWRCIAICPWFFFIRNSGCDKGQITKKQPTGHAIVRVLSWLAWRKDCSLWGLADVKVLFFLNAAVDLYQKSRAVNVLTKNPNFCTDCFCPLGCSIPMRPQMDFLAENRATHLE